MRLRVLDPRVKSEADTQGLFACCSSFPGLTRDSTF